jgi:hypothetical protein
MEWQEAKESTIRFWKGLRDSIDSLGQVDLLREINAVNELCEKAKQESRGEWGRCGFCIAYTQFGGCTGISMRMSECVVDGDRQELRRLVDQFIGQLEALELPA